MVKLAIDEEFQNKIPPLTDEEFKQLEENIVNDGEIREPIITWNNTIVDGHNRYKIALLHPEIKFSVKRMDFADKFEAIVWMCRNQLGRRNITDVQKRLLIAAAYEAQKQTRGGDRRSEQTQGKSSDQNDLMVSTRNPAALKVAKDFGVGEATVRRAANYVEGLDIADEISPGIKADIVSGKTKANGTTIRAIKFIPQEAQKAVVDAVKQGKPKVAAGLIKEVRKPPEPNPEPTDRVSQPLEPDPLETMPGAVTSGWGAAADFLPVEASEPLTVSEFAEQLEGALSNFTDAVRLHLAVQRKMLEAQEMQEVLATFCAKAIETIKELEKFGGVNNG